MADQVLDDKTIIDPDAPPAPVEIDVEVEEGGEQPVAPAAGAEPPKPKQRANTAVREALRRAEEAEARAQAADAARQTAEAERDAAKRGESVALTNGMENYARRITSEADQAQAELQGALESGDAAKIAAANRKVAKVAAAEADVEAWRASQPSAPTAEPTKPQAPTAPAAQPDRPISSATAAFFQENPWFTAVQMDSSGRPFVGRDGRMVANPQFDEDMHDAAMIIHRKIERKVKRGEVDAEYIESPEYFDEIRTKMQEEFPDAFEGDDATPAAPARRTPPMAPARQPVAPATRGAAPGAAPRTAKVTLSGETASFVRSLVDNGTMRYSGNHPQRGKPMAYEDAYKEYAKQQKLIPQHPVN